VNSLTRLPEFTADTTEKEKARQCMPRGRPTEETTSKEKSLKKILHVNADCVKNKNKLFIN